MQTHTYLNVADNNGVRKLMCIQVLGTSNMKYAHMVMSLLSWLRKPFKPLSFFESPPSKKG